MVITMGNKTEHNDVVMITLDKPRELRIGHKALKMFSALSGLPLSRLQDAINNYDKLACLYYCMLHADDGTVTVEALDDLLDRVPVKTLIIKASDALHNAFPSDEDAEAASDPTNAAGTGTIA